MLHAPRKRSHQILTNYFNYQQEQYALIAMLVLLPPQLEELKIVVHRKDLVIIRRR